MNSTFARSLTVAFTSALAAATCAVGVAPTAQAKVIYETNGGPLFQGQLGVEFVQCPKGSKVVGGGLRTSGNFADAVRVVQSGPENGLDGDRKPDDAWHGEYMNFHGPDGVQTSAFAVCIKGNLAGDVVYATEKGRATASDQGFAVAQCPGRSRVIGGGVASGSTTSQTLVNSTFPGAGHRPDRWTVYMDNSGPNVFKFGVIAICAEGELARRLSYRSAVRDVPKGTQDYSDVECKPGDKLLGGGVSHPLGFGTAYLNSAYPTDGSDPDGAIGDSWLSYVDYVSGDPAFLPVTSYATCLKD